MSALLHSSSRSSSLLQPRSGQVHLWQLDLDSATDTDVYQYGEIISSGEHARASRFYYERDCRRSIVGRGFVRTVLSRYVGLAPERLEIGSGPFGKPMLLGSASEWQFNVSHSGGLLLLAVTHQRAIGVDVEYMKGEVSLELLSGPHFPAGELERIQGAPEWERAELFFQCWTRTEARLKAAGTGFAGGPYESEPKGWSLHTLTPAPGYTAALAIEGTDYATHSLSWQN
jgi:4'-phosphopantetheinyl transferase